MKTRSLQLGLLLAALALALIACTGGDDGPPPCTPLEGESRDPCEGDAGAALARFAAAYSNIRADSIIVGEEPLPVRWHLDGGWGAIRVGHIAARGQFLPHTVRCIHHWGYRSQLGYTSETWVLKCYADIQVSEYIVGSGPPTLTAVVVMVKRAPAPADPEAVRADVERNLIVEGISR